MAKSFNSVICTLAGGVAGNAAYNFIVGAVSAVSAAFSAHSAAVKNMPPFIYIPLAVLVFLGVTIGAHLVAYFFFNPTKDTVSTSLEAAPTQSAPPTINELTTADETKYSEQIEELKGHMKELEREANQYSWLRQIADYEQAEIRSAVTIRPESFLYTDLEGGAPYIIFNFYVHNCSVFTIRIDDDDVSGFVKCVTAPIGKRMEIYSNRARNCLHGSGNYLSVRVWLLKDDIALMKNSTNIYFRFDQLKVIVKGSNKFPQVTPQRVEIDWVINGDGKAQPFRN
jgi:hypothetical protein